MLAMIESRLSDLRRLCARYYVRRLELFGSAATGAADAWSDLDFLVEFGEVPPGRHADCYFGLLESLESLFERHVDLAETKAIQNPYFLTAIEKTRKVLYEA